MASSTRDPISVSVITGFLGSGKTTLLNRLLASPGMERTAVIVNEFGEVGIDHLIVREIDEATVLLKSGCICCTVQGELVDGLKELYMKGLAGTLPPFTRVVIETTGLADPLPIVTCLVRDPLFKHVYRLDALVTTVDAVHGEAQLDRYTEAVRQAAVADRLVITKSDLAEANVPRLRARLGALNPGAAIIVAVQGHVAPSRLFDAGPFDPRTKSADVQRWLNDEAYVHAGRHAHAHSHSHAHDEAAPDVVDVNRHDERITSFCLTLDEPVAWAAVKGWFEELTEKHGDRILRAKGIVNVLGESEPFIVQCVQSTLYPSSQLAAWPSQDRRSRIVFITEDLPRCDIESSLGEHVARAAQTGANANRAPKPPAPDAGAGHSGRWLNEAELSRIFQAFTFSPDRTASDLLRLMLLTGVPTADIRQASWADIDLDRRVWMLPRSQSPASSIRSRPRRVALGDAAAMLLTDLRGRASGQQLFSSLHGAGGMLRVQTAWQAASESAKITDLPLESVRPVLATNLFRGLPLTLARKLLGLIHEDH
ncbi:MAG: GTP-binding protein [Burkholderiaceae bacterium]|nr:GTP-binding protein [Burkholderiaceae bacterium]